MLTVLLLSVATHAALSQDAVLHPDGKLSTVKFTIRNFGFAVQGSFSPPTGDISFDAGRPQQAKFDVSLQAASINTGNRKRDSQLRSADFFDCERYPLIRVRATRAEAAGNGLYRLHATLDMHGASGTIEIPFAVRKEGDYWLFEGSFAVNRLAYQVGSSSLAMADEATVNLKIYAK